MINRDMMYGGYYQNIPGSMIESNYNMQLPPGALMPNNMMTPFNMNNGMNNNMNNPIIELNNRITSLENRVRTLEQKSSGNTNIYQDDSSLYMI